MKVYVHLVEGTNPTDRLARVGDLARASRRPVVVFAETSEPPCSPLDWLMGPGCSCCLPAEHPRVRVVQAADAPGPVRIIIDAGPPVLADRIADILGALPVELGVSLSAA